MWQHLGRAVDTVMRELALVSYEGSGHDSHARAGGGASYLAHTLRTRLPGLLDLKLATTLNGANALLALRSKELWSLPAPQPDDTESPRVRHGVRMLVSRQI